MSIRDHQCAMDDSQVFVLQNFIFLSVCIVFAMYSSCGYCTNSIENNFKEMDNSCCCYQRRSKVLPGTDRHGPILSLFFMIQIEEKIQILNINRNANRTCNKQSARRLLCLHMFQSQPLPCSDSFGSCGAAASTKKVRLAEDGCFGVLLTGLPRFVFGHVGSLVG